MQDPDPVLEVMDPDPELDLNLTKIHQKIINLIIIRIRIQLRILIQNSEENGIRVRINKIKFSDPQYCYPIIHQFFSAMLLLEPAKSAI
jgi:hypothetical protein